MDINKYFLLFSLHDCKILEIEFQNDRNVIMNLFLSWWVLDIEKYGNITEGMKETVILRNAKIIDLYIDDEGVEYDDIDKYYQSKNYQDIDFEIFKFLPILTSTNKNFSIIEIYGEMTNRLISMKIKCESIDWETEWWKELIRKKEADG